MKMNYRTLIVVSLILMFLMLPVTAGAITEVTVVGGGDGFSDEHDLAEFHAAHPDIRISILSANNDQVITMLASGNAPDLIRVESRFTPFWASKGLLEDLSPYIEKHARFITPGDLVPVNNLYVLDGRQYALNKDWSADLTLYYNKDLFDGAGITYLSEDEPVPFEELQALSQKLSRSEPNGPQHWGFASLYAPLGYQGMMRSADQPFYSDDQKQVLLSHSEGALTAAEWWIDMADRQWLSKESQTERWHSGSLGILQAGFWFGPVAAIGGHHNTHANEMSKGGEIDPIGFAPAPIFGEQRVNLAVATGFAMLSDSKNKEAAWKVLEWFTVGPPAIRRTRIGWGIPPMQSLFQYIPMDTALDRQRYKVTVAETPYLVTHYENKYDAAAFDQGWNTWFHAAANREISPREFLLRVEHDVNAALERAAQK